MKKLLAKVVPALVFATMLIAGSAPLASADSGLLFGQNHYYSVVMRGNGEAIVYAKLVVTNSDNMPMTDFSFDLSKVTPSEIAIYQMKLPQECAQTSYDGKQTCLQYRDPDYAQQYYYYGYSNGTAEYQKVAYTVSGGQYHVTLPTPVAPYKTTALIVAYAAKGYVSQSMGLSTFNFETIKVASRIQAVRVTVDVDTDQILKGTQSNVNYAVPSAGVGLAAAPTSVSNKELDNVVGRIGSYGALVKDAKNLASGESFVVHGEYATSWWRLYLSEIVWTIVLIAAIFVAIYFLITFLKKRRAQNAPVSSESSLNTMTIAPQGGSVLSITNAWVSLVSAGLVVGLTYGVEAFTRLNLFGYDQVIGLIVFITILILYVLAIFGPAAIVAIKGGWKSFITILGAEFFWLIVFLVVYSIIFHSGTSNPTIYPMSGL